MDVTGPTIYERATFFSPILSMTGLAICFNSYAARKIGERTRRLGDWTRMMGHTYLLDGKLWGWENMEAG